MTESKMQSGLVTWFWNTFQSERGTLIEINNNTTRGASRKAIGLVKGASDLVYCSDTGMFCALELKAPHSRHDVKHLQRQLAFIEKINSRMGLGIFLYSLEHAKDFLRWMLQPCDSVANDMVVESLNYMRERIDWATFNRKKTVLLDFKYKKV